MLNEAQRREKERAVYEAVLKLLGEGQDLSDLTVSQIAAAAGIGKGTVYEYFPSKKEIVYSLTDYCMEEELVRLQAALEPCHTLQAAGEAMLAYIRDLTRGRIAGYRIIVRVLARSSDYQPLQGTEHWQGRLQAILQALYDRLQAAGELAPGTDPEYFFHVAAAAWLPCLIAFSPCGDHLCHAQPQNIVARTRRMVAKALQG